MTSPQLSDELFAVVSLLGGAGVAAPRAVGPAVAERAKVRVVDSCSRRGSVRQALELVREAVELALVAAA